jgi:hypothetical protein
LTPALATASSLLLSYFHFLLHAQQPFRVGRPASHELKGTIEVEDIRNFGKTLRQGPFFAFSHRFESTSGCVLSLSLRSFSRSISICVSSRRCASCPAVISKFSIAASSRAAEWSASSANLAPRVEISIGSPTDQAGERGDYQQQTAVEDQERYLQPVQARLPEGRRRKVGVTFRIHRDRHQGKGQQRNTELNGDEDPDDEAFDHVR